MSMQGDLKRYLRRNTTLLADLDKAYSRMGEDPRYLDDFIEGLLEVISNFRSALNIVPAEGKWKPVRVQIRSLLKKALSSKKNGKLNESLLMATIDLRSSLNEIE